jgi:hypothetical protein
MFWNSDMCLVYTAEDITWGLRVVSEGTKAFLNISGPSQVCLKADTGSFIVRFWNNILQDMFEISKEVEDWNKEQTKNDRGRNGKEKIRKLK